METLYRRPLPDGAIAFASPEGRRLFAAALASGGLDGYFRLAEQFHTQSEPAFCGLGSLVVALNALAIDPGRLWKGAWRWFAEELLDCCVSLDEIRRRGLDLDELACLARCNGAEVELRRPDGDDGDRWRAALAAAARGDGVVIASYHRPALGQTGAGHFSPIGGFHAAGDLALILDVARFKYPPHWVPAEQLLGAMRPVDPATGRSRGWLVLRPRAAGAATGYSLRCDGGDWRELGSRLATLVAGTASAVSLAGVARSLAPLTAQLAQKPPVSAAHRSALERAVRGLTGFDRLVEAVGDTLAEAVMVLILALGEALVDRLPHPLGVELAALLGEAARDAALAPEIAGLRAELDALATIAGAARCGDRAPC